MTRPILALSLLLSAGLALGVVACDGDAAGTCDGVDCSGLGECHLRDGEPLCVCEAGSLPDGLSCVPVSCDDLVCDHGSCAVSGTGARCACEPGWAGEACDACAAGFEPDGDRCLAIGDPCDPDPCGEHGRCTHEDRVPSCVCDDGYDGPTCATCATGWTPAAGECLDPCADDPCAGEVCGAHGACSCDSAAGGVACACAAGYAGDRCDRCAPGHVRDNTEADPVCVEAGPPCNDVTFTYDAPAATSVWLTGTFTDPQWAGELPGAIALSDTGAGRWAVTRTLPLESRHAYKFIVDGDTWVADPNNPLTEDDGFGGVNSVIEVCSASCDPNPCHEGACGGRGACACDDATGAAVCACDPGWAGAACATCAPGYARESDACVVRAECGDVTAFDWRDAVMYFAMVDRFYDSDGLSDPIAGATGMNAHGASGQYEGGDLAGVTTRMDYLTDLGVTALWITAPFENRDLVGQGLFDDKQYTGYHGYWPSPAAIDYSDPDAPTPTPQVEARIGTAADLHALVAAAHGAESANGHGVKVLFDYVMNHVDAASGLAAAHPGWFTDDGAGGVPLCEPNGWWDDPYWGVRCAFTEYLPAFDFSLAAPRAWSIADAVWWARTFGIDGYRLDAIKHVPFAWLTELRAALAAAFPAPAGDRFYLVGETFDYFDRTLLKAYVNPDTRLDGQFDFPFRRELCEALFHGGLDDFATWMAGNDGFYDAAGASKRSLMTTWIGNHDIPRAIHYASGQIANCTQGSAADNGWTGDYPQPADGVPYERLGLAFAVMFTNPGIPLIYYGDEIGLAGGGDPDNRRMMPWDDGALNAHQLALRDRVGALARLRAAAPALSRGVRETLSTTADTWVYRMGGCGGDVADVLVAINRADDARDVTLPAGAYTDLLTDTATTGGPRSLAARSYLVLRVD